MQPNKPALSQSLDHPQSSPYRWVMLAILWGVYASFGLAQRSLPPLVTPILTDLQMSYSQMGFVLGSWQLTYIATAFMAGFIIDRWGVRRSLFLGSAVIALSIGLRYFALGFFSFLLVVALVGVGGPMMSVGCPKTIALWFSGRDRATAVGIYMTGPAIGGAFALVVTNRVIMPATGYSWRLTFVVYSLMALAAALMWWFLSRDIETAGDSSNPGLKKVFLNLIRVRNIQIVLLSGLLGFAIFHGTTSWLPKIMESKGFAPTMAGYAASLPVLASIPSFLILPRLIPPKRRSISLAVMALATSASTLLFFNQTGIPMFVGLFIFGCSSGLLTPLFMLILMDTPAVGAQNMGTAGGLFFCISEIGGFTSPLVMGVLVDWTGDFMAGGYFVAAMALAILALALLLRNETE